MDIDKERFLTDSYSVIANEEIRNLET